MSQTIPISFRPTPEQLTELERIRLEHGVPIALLIRWAVDGLLIHIQRHNGRLILPLDFSETWSLMQDELKANKPE